MKRFLVFAYNQYQPSGGWHDLWGMFDVIADAEIAARSAIRRGAVRTFDFAHIVDTQTGDITEFE